MTWLSSIIYALVGISGLYLSAFSEELHHFQTAVLNRKSRHTGNCMTAFPLLFHFYAKALSFICSGKSASSMEMLTIKET